MRNSTLILIARRWLHGVIAVNAVMWLSLGVMLPLSTALRAQDATKADFAVVGKPFYESGGHSALYIATEKVSKDHPQKFAVLVVEFEKSDEHYLYNGTYGKQAVGFAGADDWRKFLVAWKKARALPVADNYFKSFSYFDGDTLLDVTKDSEANMGFTMASNPDANNLPKELNVFDLSAKDVPAFEAAVKTVSLYFRK
jgi:hypothetical protein